MLTLKDKAEIFVKNSQFKLEFPSLLYRYLWKAGNPFIPGFHEHKAIFVHIPKAAGSSVSETLFGEPVGHRPIRRHRLYSPHLSDKYFKFTFVRNPWDRLYSAYHYFNVRVGSVAHRDHRWASYYLRGIGSFEQFVSRLDDPEYALKVKSYDHFRDQVDWVVDSHNNKLVMDFVGRFESLNRDFNYVKSQLGSDVDLPHRRKGPDGFYRKEYSKDMIDIVARLYKRDILSFGYDFG